MTAVVPDPLEQPLLRAEEVATILGCGRTAVHDAIARGEVPSVRIGARVLVPTAALRRDVLAIDPPGPTVDVVLAALRQLLDPARETAPGCTPGTALPTNDATATQHSKDHGAA